MLHRFARKEGERGFTLIELLIVMALLGVLVAVLLPKYQDLTPEAKIAATQQHLETLRSAVLLYTSKNYNPVFPPHPDSLITKGFIPRRMPEIKISGSSAVTISSPMATSSSNSGQWLYDPITGDVRVDINDITTFISNYSGTVNPFEW
jgi:prepilin-type N-terminal cleavage/methylation domain-containing protein